MNQKQTSLLVLIAILIAVGASTAAIKQNEKRKAAETELASLKALIDTVQTASETTRSYTTPDTTEIDQLKSELAQLQETREHARGTHCIPAANPESTLTQEPERESYTDRMERLKEENPEEYQRIIDERRERQQNAQYSLAQRTAMFIEMDTSYMSEAERKPQCLCRRTRLHLRTNPRIQRSRNPAQSQTNARNLAASARGSTYC